MEHILWIDRLELTRTCTPIANNNTNRQRDAFQPQRWPRPHIEHITHALFNKNPQFNQCFHFLRYQRYLPWNMNLYHRITSRQNAVVPSRTRFSKRFRVPIFPMTLSTWGKLFEQGLGFFLYRIRNNNANPHQKRSHCGIFFDADWHCGTNPTTPNLQVTVRRPIL